MAGVDAEVAGDFRSGVTRVVYTCYAVSGATHAGTVPNAPGLKKMTVDGGNLSESVPALPMDGFFARLALRARCSTLARIERARFVEDNFL